MDWFGDYTMHPKTHKRPVTTKKWKPTPKILKDIEQWAEDGLSEASIAINLGMHPKTFSRFKNSLDDADYCFTNKNGDIINYVEDRIKRGRSSLEDYAVSKLREKIDGGCTASLLFLLKTRCGWNEKHIYEDVSTKNAPKFKAFKVSKNARHVDIIVKK